MSLAAILNPWKARRERALRRLAELRRRDGDACRRCRRPMRFDLPEGNDLAPRLEQVGPGAKGVLDHLCLCHTRCNAEAGDQTIAVQQRLREREEAAEEKRRKRRKPARRAA
jgi:hypothetical protein